MALHLEMSNELESRLRQKAESLGVTVEKLATELLSASIEKERHPQNGSDLVESWRAQGLIGYRTDISDPSEHARALRQSADRRNR